ncbi:MAG: hypothetical protein ACREK3_08070 [Gemmatimonadota bacterium]
MPATELCINHGRPVMRLFVAPSLLVLGLLAGACGGRTVQPWQYAPRPMADTLAILEPVENEIPLVYESAHQFVIRPIGEPFTTDGEALNADTQDEVVNSTWFTNRNAVAPLAPEEVRRGPQTIDGPVPPLTVTDVDPEGVTPKFNVEDANGITYIVKLDPAEHPELASGAEVVATNLFWAAGYNTPENYVYYVDPSELELEDGVEIYLFGEDSLPIQYEVAADEVDERELTLEIFNREFFGNRPRRADGRVRAMASRFLEGIPKGPFNYAGTRPDDPNDVVPHEHRRELRGLYVMEAWLHQTDTKAGNSLDMFILGPGSPEDEEARRWGFLRHNLIDFGSALGSAAVRPHVPRHGQENSFDLAVMGKRFITLGLYRKPWQSETDVTYPPAAGYYTSKNFDPDGWKPNIPNPAFDNLTARDGYWGAKLVMSFTDAQLFAAVEAGQYSDPEAARYILRGLRERRDMTGRYWLAQVSPLDDPRIESGALVFDDLWIRYFGGLAQYRWEFDWEAPDPDLEAEGESTVPSIVIPRPEGSVTLEEEDPTESLARLRVWKIQADSERAPRPATFWLEWTGGGWRLVGARY